MRRVGPDVLNDINERLGQTKAFKERVYTDEPIVRRGYVPKPKARPVNTERVPTTEPLRTEGIRTESLRPRLELPAQVKRIGMPAPYRQMRKLQRTRASAVRAGSGKLFYEQARLMEDFEDDFEGTSDFNRYYPTYESMSDYDLRVYFGWRTRLRHGSYDPAPASFRYLLAYELLCGIGVATAQEGYESLRKLRDAYGADDAIFTSHLSRWMHDYAVYYGLDPSGVEPFAGSFSYASVALLRRTEAMLLSLGDGSWPEQGAPELPDPQELLDALMCLSRYRAERSRFVRDHREDIAWVASRVFGQMVAHCHKRRKTGFVMGLFGPPSKMSYRMFASAVFWAESRHADCVYEGGEGERYVCTSGFWWRELPCRRTETSRELGSILHAIDCRMRERTDDSHPLKARSLAKYQGKFIDDQIDALFALRAEEERRRIHIDRSSLGNIRSASARTREALLTDEEREETVASIWDTPPEKIEPPVEVTHTPTAPATISAPELPSTSVLENTIGLSPDHVALLKSLLRGEKPSGDSLFVSLAVDSINEAFLDIVGDTVVEFDGDEPCLVEDYEEDIREALGIQEQ